MTDTIRRIARRCARAMRLLKPSTPDIDTRPSTTAIEIEWGFDLDSVTTERSFGNGNPQKASLKRRCAGFWGGLVGRLNDHHQVTGIKCRVCGEKLEGDAARDEHTRMQSEGATNMLNIEFGWLPRYADDATFVQKVLPVREHVPKDEVAARIAQATAKPNKEKQHLTRHDFPPGSPGFFVLQATVLMASVEDVSSPGGWSIADFPHVRFRDDGTAVCTLYTSGMTDDPQFRERRLTRRMGQTMTAAMISAFACELAMKAITLTAEDKAAKTHDLLALYRNLPRTQPPPDRSGQPRNRSCVQRRSPYVRRVAVLRDLYRRDCGAGDDQHRAGTEPRQGRASFWMRPR